MQRSRRCLPSYPMFSPPHNQERLHMKRYGASVSPCRTQTHTDLEHLCICVRSQHFGTGLVIRVYFTTVYTNLTHKVSDYDLNAVIRLLKVGKAPGPDNIHPEFLQHSGPVSRKWIRIFFSHCKQVYAESQKSGGKLR